MEFVMRSVIFCSLFLFVTTITWANDSLNQTSAAPAPPDIPPLYDEGETLEPEVTIIESDKETIHQYSIRGKVYMIKVIPRNGAPYYLVDTDGDGVIDVQPDGPRSIAVQQWILFNW